MRQRSKPAALASHALDLASAPQYQFERPSKTRLKQQAHDLQALGQALVELPAGRLKDLAMPDGLREAIAEYRRTKSFEGQRRQLQYIGKQMRLADVAPLQEAVDHFRLGSAQDTLMLHECELWRDQLVANDEAATRWAAQYPGSDLQQLRSLVRAARKDAAAAPEQRNGRGYRELFQFVKPWLADAAGADAQAKDDSADGSADD
jgi:ribosome-associated protein